MRTSAVVIGMMAVVGYGAAVATAEEASSLTPARVHALSETLRRAPDPEARLAAARALGAARSCGILARALASGWHDRELAVRQAVRASAAAAHCPADAVERYAKAPAAEPPSRDPRGAPEPASLPSPEEYRSHQLRLDVGFASALGLAGLAYGYSATRHLELEVGMGVGFSGVQLSFMPKLSLGSARHRFVAGLGLSLATNTSAGESGSIFGQGPVLWLNVNLVGYQLRTKSGFTFLIALGSTTLAAGGDRAKNECFFDACNPSTVNRNGATSLQGRIGFGYSW